MEKMYQHGKRLDSENGGESNMKKFKTSIISEHVESTELQELFFEHWHNLKPIKTDKIEIITKPYRICKISNFLKDDCFIDKIKDELRNVKTRRNEMDLYQFKQTDDLANVDSENISNLYRTFKSDMKNWMEKNTKIILNGKISMSGSSYSDTDYLLCHDDNMGDRRIAFVLYLSDNWTSEDGGTLDIFDTDDNCQPNNIVRSLLPEYNSLVLFEVVDNSYHQVAEITTRDKSRLSINGWFHGPLRESNKQRRIERIYKYHEPVNMDVDLVTHISQIYLFESIVENIQKTIEKDSFIYLPDFLIPEIYETLSVDVKSKHIIWEKIGPADLRNYETARENTLPNSFKQFYDILKSVDTFHLFKQYTELDLMPETEEMKPKMKIELQRWSRGCYMLIKDKQVMGSIKNEKEESMDNESNDNQRRDSELVADPQIQKELDEDSSNESQDGENEDGATQSLTTKSNELISSSMEKEIVPGENNIPPKINEGSKEGVKNKCTKGKEKVYVSKIVQEKESRVSDEYESSDIEDYLSNYESESKSETTEPDEDDYLKPGILDALLQFNTNNVPEEATIDYIDPSQKDGALIHVPPQDNHLCLVYRTSDICRCNKYVNHYCKDYFYTLVCSYYE